MMPKTDPNTPLTLDEQVAVIKTEIDRELELFFDHKITEAGRVDPHYRKLMLEMKKLTLRGGKRLRPFLIWLSWTLGGGSDRVAMRHLAVAIEIYHSGALIHDDIMDQDHTRHGGLNIAGVYERSFKRSHSQELAAKHSLNAALLAGDAAMLMAAEYLSNLPTELETRDRLVNAFYKMHFRLVGGQLVEDQAALAHRLTPAQIRKIYANKSGYYSLVTPLRMGGMLAGSNETILNILEKYGQHAGVAFQIADDLLGMFGSTRDIGKPNTSDLREGKRTLLMHYGFAFADETQKTILTKYFGNPKVGAHELKLVRKVLSDNGAKAKTIFAAQAEGEAAKKSIGKLAMPAKLSSTFIEFTNYLVNRKV